MGTATLVRQSPCTSRPAGRRKRSAAASTVPIQGPSQRFRYLAHWSSSARALLDLWRSANGARSSSLSPPPKVYLTANFQVTVPLKWGTVFFWASPCCALNLYRRQERRSVRPNASSQVDRHDATMSKNQPAARHKSDCTMRLNVTW